MCARPRKLYGNPTSQLTKLKTKWLRMPAEERAEWQELFGSTETQRVIRERILEKLEVNLKSDGMLTNFRHWEADQRERDLEAERQAEDERRFMEEHEHCSLDEARVEVLKKAYLRSAANGDFKLGLATVNSDVYAQTVGLDREKLELLKRKAEQAEKTEKVLQKPTMTPEERQAAIRAIYGRA